MRVKIDLLGGFDVRVDERGVPGDTWRRRRGAAALVKLLALAPRRRLPRDRVLAALWPGLPPEIALPRLHTAAHYARRAFGAADAVVLAGGTVGLLPAADVSVDVIVFEAAAGAALRSGPDPAACGAVADRYQPELLPDDGDPEWTQGVRERIRRTYAELLRGAGRWDELIDLIPVDERAHVALIRAAVLAGDGTTALRRYHDLTRVLASELQVEPGAEARAWRDRAVALQDPDSSAVDPISAGSATADRPIIDRPPAPPGGPVAVETPPVGPDVTLLEREGDLVAIGRILRSALRNGRGAVVSITGEAGSGKSSLARAFLRTVGPPVQVATGSCDDLLAPPSLGPFRDMAVALPGLARVLAEQRPVEEVFPELLRVLAARPTVLVIEDVHWADDVTLDAIRYLTRRIAGTSSLLILTFRTEDVDLAHPLHRALGGLGGTASRHLELTPLSVAAIRRLGGVDDAEADRIHRVTKGNPFFVTEILATPGREVPATVRDAVLARVGRLPPAGRALVQRLAVVPSRAERWLADALAGTEPDAVPQAERSGVLSGTTDVVSFRHELARRALESSLTVGERVRAHREVLDVLLSRPDVEPARIVHHAARAARPDLLARYGPAAVADAERARAHRQAAETIRVLLELGGPRDEAATADLLTRRAYALYLVNEYETALAEASAAVASAEASGDAVLVSDALVVLSRIVYFARGPMVARQAAGRAVDLLAGVDDEPRLAVALIEMARTHSNLATIGVVAQPSRTGLRTAERAVALCRRLGRDDLLAQPMCYLGSARLAMADARGYHDIAQGVRLGGLHTRFETRVRGYVNAAGSAYRAGRFDDAKRYVADGLREAADGAFTAGQYRLSLTSAAIAASEGEWDRAIADLRRLLAGDGDAGIMAPLARSLLARLLARRGDPDARRVLAEAVAEPVAAGDSYVAGPLAVARVEVGWLTGTPVTTGDVAGVVRLATDAGHTAIVGELACYLRRAGQPVPVPVEVPGPWAAGLVGRWRDAAAAWAALGDRYERAVELAGGDDVDLRGLGIGLLGELGATATAARMRGGAR